MATITDLSDDLLVKILSFLPTKDAVSTSILSRQWEFLWLLLPNLEFYCNSDLVRDFVNKNLPLLKAPIINRLHLRFDVNSLEAETFKSWVEIAVSHGVRNLTIVCDWYTGKEHPVYLFIPSSLYTCNSLVTLELEGNLILVDVPGKACLSSLKVLHLSYVTYSTQDSFRLLLSCCPVLEDLFVNHHRHNNALVIVVPSLLRLSLYIANGYTTECVIVTPSLKYFKIGDERYYCPFSIEHMPLLEEADIFVSMDSYLEDLLKSIITVKRLSLNVTIYGGNETMYGDGNVFSKLENLKLTIWGNNWSKVTFRLLKDSPNLQALDLEVCERTDFYELPSDDETSSDDEGFGDDEPVGWISNQSLVPECLLNSLKTFKFRGYTKEVEARDLLSFINKHACCLESPPILC